jgi:probable rRNA maturation factor
MIQIQISDSLDEDALAATADTQLFEQAAQQTLIHEKLAYDADLTLVLTDDDQVHSLNRQFRQVDAPTDVLSFPAGDIDPDTGNQYLGDIIISIPRALAQAEAESHSNEDELRLLVVHGVLHLLGYDHADDQEQLLMWAAQAEILARLKN